MARTPAKPAKPAAKPVARTQPVSRRAVASKPAAKTSVKPAAKTTSRTKVAAAIGTTLGTVVNQYDAGGQGRRVKGWKAPNSGPNAAIKGLQTIRNRSRDAVRNDWTNASTLQHWTTNLIGTGIVPRVDKIESESQREVVELLWDDWCKVCDADSLLNFYGLQTLATRAWLESGECFVRIRPRRIDGGMEVPMQIQLLEADMVPMLDADTWPRMPSGNKIRSGIELNRSNQKVAYWVYKEHPGDKPCSPSADQLVRIAKSQMLHIMEPKRIGQLRGVPDFAPVLVRVRNTLDVDDAVIERYKIANLFAAFIKQDSLPGFNDGTDPVTGKAIEAEEDGDPMVGLEPGIVHKLIPGESMEFANPPEAGTTYSEFIRGQHIGSTAGVGMPYELASGDIREIQDRTLRIIINEFRRYAEQRQWQIIIPQMCQPVREAWVDMATIVGKIGFSLADNCKRVQWAPQGWAYIHPTQDVEAKTKEVEAGFRSRDSVIAERGDDPNTVDKERAASKKRAKRLGLDNEQVKTKPAQPNPNQPKPDPEALLEQMLNLLAAIKNHAESTGAI